MTDKIDTRVIQVTNIAPNVQKDQMKTLFNYLGRIDEIKLYPSEYVYICIPNFFLSFSIYCLALAFEHYWQVNIVHSGLQDESLQVTISKLPKGSLTCTGGDFPCTGNIQLTSRSEGRCTYLVSSLQMTLENRFGTLLF